MDHSMMFQCSMLLRSALLGVLMAAAYDVFRLLRGTEKGLAAQLLDALYGLIFCTAVFVFVVCVLRSSFRIWQLVGAALGMLAWFLLAGKWFRRALRGLFRLLCAPIRLAAHMIQKAGGYLRRRMPIRRKNYKNIQKGTFHFHSNRLK
ncbi:MAG: spore cortex biosynthesis protein YabQ [Butyricicoccaceae bacterium]